MSKRTFNFATGIIGGVAAIASATVTFFAPPFTPAIIAAIGIAVTATTEILSLFTKVE